MSKKLIAIGGGENGRILEDGTKTLYETAIIDKEIVNLTNTLNPNFLFLAHAMYFSSSIQDSYFETMKKIYGKMYNCSCKHLKTSDLSNLDLVESLINWADIIYIGGGDTKGMIKLWQETDFMNKLKEAYNKEKVICGISAGGVCFFNSCNSDINNNEFEIVEGLNWFDLFITPHANEKGRYETTKLQLLQNKKVGLMLSNLSAIEIIDNEYKILVANPLSYAIKCYYKNNKFHEEKLEINKFKSLKELLNIK